jgi:hypothetical protein
MYAYNSIGNSSYSNEASTIITGIAAGGDGIPASYSLHQNYPNPFNPVTKIRFDLPNAVYVKLVISDILGREAAYLINELMQPGRHEINWNAGALPSGVYFYKLEAIPSAGSGQGFVNIKRLILLK